MPASQPGMPPTPVYQMPPGAIPAATMQVGEGRGDAHAGVQQTRTAVELVQNITLSRRVLCCRLCPAAVVVSHSACVRSPWPKPALLPPPCTQTPQPTHLPLDRLLLLLLLLLPGQMVMASGAMMAQMAPGMMPMMPPQYAGESTSPTTSTYLPSPQQKHSSTPPSDACMLGVGKHSWWGGAALCLLAVLLADVPLCCCVCVLCLRVNLCTCCPTPSICPQP